MQRRQNHLKNAFLKVPNALKRLWLVMLEPPWRHSEPDDEKGYHWVFWLVGWTWTLAGLVFGALVAPTLVQVVGLGNSSYQDWLVIAVAVLAGIFVQLLGVALIAVTVYLPIYFLDDSEINVPDVIFSAYTYLGLPVVLLLPLTAAGYGIYRYLTWVGSEQRSVTIAFVGALLIKTFAIPLIKGIVTGALFRWVIRALGGKDKKTA